MARLLHSLNVTVGGSCHHEDVVADQEHHEYALDLLRAASAVLLGRSTFDLFAAFWPDAATRQDLPEHIRAFAAELRNKPKLVISSSPVQTNWQNTCWVRGPSLEDLQQRLSEASGTIVVLGSPSLGASLASAGLLAEVHLLMQPLLASSHTRPYPGLEGCKPLRLLGTDQFKSGVVLLRYGIDA
jgi:dihydrofolate reductase